MKKSNDIRAKYREVGYSNLSDIEKVKLILSYSERSRDADKLADRLAENYGSLRTMADADPLMLMNEYGFSQNTAVLLGLIPALTRVCAINGCRDILLNTPENAKKFFKAYFKNCRSEVIAIASVNKNFRITGSMILKYGTSSDVTMSYRRAMNFAYNHDAAGIFIAHCHPTGGCNPSENDVSATIKLIEALSLLDIPLADHIITCGDDALSMRESVHGNIFCNGSKDFFGYFTKDE